MLLNGAYILSEKPIILGAGESMLPSLNQAALEAKLPERPVVLSAIMWNKEPWPRIIKILFKTSFVYRHLNLHWLGNTQAEVAKLRKLGLKATHLHHNLFCMDFSPLNQWRRNGMPSTTHLWSRISELNWPPKFQI